MVPEWKEPPMTKEDQMEKLFNEKMDSIDFSFNFKDKKLNPDKLKHRQERKIIAVKSYTNVKEGRFGLIATHESISLKEGFGLCAPWTFLLTDLKERTVQKIFELIWDRPDVPFLAKMHLQFDSNKEPEFAGFILLERAMMGFLGGPQKLHHLDTYQDMYIVKV